MAVCMQSERRWLDFTGNVAQEVFYSEQQEEGAGCPAENREDGRHFDMSLEEKHGLIRLAAFHLYQADSGPAYWFTTGAEPPLSLFITPVKKHMGEYHCC